jgi:hypothetical protein
MLTKKQNIHLIRKKKAKQYNIADFETLSTLSGLIARFFVANGPPSFPKGWPGLPRKKE